MKKFYSLELFNKESKDNFVMFLKDNHIYYELSGMGDGWHFEIKADLKELEKCNNFKYSLNNGDNYHE